MVVVEIFGKMALCWQATLCDHVLCHSITRLTLCLCVILSLQLLFGLLGFGRVWALLGC